MGHQPTTQRVQGAAAAVIGIAVALYTLSIDKGVDTVALYSFQHSIPNRNALDDAYKKGDPSEVIALAAMKALEKSCEFSTFSIGRSPACQCVHTILGYYGTASNRIVPKSGWANSSLESRFGNASAAVKACFSSQQFVPQTNFLWKDQYDINDIDTRKVVSRGGLVLVVALSVVFALIYNSISFSESSGMYIMIANVVLAVVALVQVFLPGLWGVNFSGITSLFSIIIIPSFFIEFVLVELAWSYIYKRRRTAFTHPYVFVTVLSALFVMAAVENGVFMWDEVFSRLLTAHSLSLAYAAGIFFVHFGCGDWKAETATGYAQQSEFSDTSSINGQTLAGYILLVFTVAGTLVVNLLPLYPTAPQLNLLWFAPWVYVAIVMGAVVMVQQVPKGDAEAEHRLHSVAHWFSLAGTKLALFVFLFYGLRALHLGFGDTFLSNSGGVLTSINFALDVRTNGFPIGSKVPLYVVP